MKISDNKLRKLINWLDKKRFNACGRYFLSVATKFNKDETVSMEVLMRICMVFHCDIGDICQIIEDWYDSSDRMRWVWSGIVDRCL